ncbi:MAG TPA: MHYT domain-containing protein [Candidatus Sulfotelmatobacter sp.]|nr:MHYT domain-containing protein [Candidatus Sulfotelmatobacter sp.]
MAAVNLIGSYNYALVALSVLIAMFASYAALDLAGRVTAAGGWTRVFWLLGGAGAMGTGIWSMHYIGMLAFILPIPVAYHWPTVLLSLFAAVLASGIALYVVSRQKMGASRAVAGSVLMGAGIASMHYIGMAAMRLPAICQFNSSRVVMSVVFAVLISFAALWITFHFRDEKTGIGREKLAGAVVMGAAIPVMHYTGMAAASFSPSGMPADLAHAVSISTLGTAGIAAITFVVLGLALLTSWMDRRFAVQTLELQEEKLQRSEAYLAEAQRLTHTGSWAWQVAGGDAVHLSEEWYRIYGFDPENGPPALEERQQRTHPEDRAKWQGAIDRAIAEKSEYEVEFRILLPDGSVKHIHTVGHPVLNASRDLVQFVGSSTDITERKRAEQATLLLAAIVESSHDAIVSKSLNGVITSWNRGAERLFGYAAEEAVGQNITLIIPPERRDEERTIIEQLTRGERVDHFETVRMRKDGSLLDVSLTISPMKDASGRVVGASKLARDITDRKRAEEALRQAQTDLAHASRLTTMGEFTASLAHEVKQPIAAAVTDANTCVRWITRDEPDLKEAREAAWRIVKDAKRAAEIINRVRLLFKKGTPQRESVDVNEVAREMIVLLGDEASRHSISVRTELAEDLPHVIGDRVQLQQVLMNLIVNGVDAMHDVDGPRELIIKSQPAENNELLLSVSDTGVGLPRNQADQIFNAFFTTKAHGTGMGLRISRSIIESHGGRLWAADNSPRGASFCFTLPTKAEADE